MSIDGGSHHPGVAWRPALVLASARGVLVALVLVAAARSPAAAGQEPDGKSFEITASRFKFDPDMIEVTEGDAVRLVLRSADTNHGLEIKEFKVKIKIPKGGEPVSVSFVASRAGTFPVTCSEFCGSGHRGMKASLVVHPREVR